VAFKNTEILRLHSSLRFSLRPPAPRFRRAGSVWR